MTQHCQLSCAEIDKLHSDGWVSLDGFSNATELRDAIAVLSSSPPELSGRLIPRNAGSVGARSFSFYHGTSRFPMHTDTAFWPVPARFVVLMAEEASVVPTLICPPSSLDVLLKGDASRRAVFAAKTTEGCLYRGIRLVPNKNFVRFDSCYMTPANDAARALASALANPSHCAIEEHLWTGRNALVVDNWRCLHGRGAAGHEPCRSLIRFYVRGEEHELG